MNDFKIAKLDGQDILKNGTSGIYYTNKERRRLNTSDNSQTIDGVHGRDVGPTFARVRIITLEGLLNRLGNSEELTSIQYLENLFALQGNLGSLQEKVLYIKDLYDQEWTLKVKIKDPLEFIEGDDSFIGSHWKWRVVLESTYNPIYKSYNEIVIIGQEGLLGGFNFPFVLSSDWASTNNIIECTTSGNIQAPAKFIINVNSNLTSIFKIINITNNTYFGLDINGVSGDIIIIDSNSKTVTKNGVNILGNRIIGSIWQSIFGTTQFIIEDSDGGLISSDFSVNVYYNNSLI